MCRNKNNVLRRYFVCRASSIPIPDEIIRIILKASFLDQCRCSLSFSSWSFFEQQLCPTCPASYPTGGPTRAPNHGAFLILQKMITSHHTTRAPLTDPERATRAMVNALDFGTWTITARSSIPTKKHISRSRDMTNDVSTRLLRLLFFVCRMFSFFRNSVVHMFPANRSVVQDVKKMVTDEGISCRVWIF